MRQDGIIITIREAKASYSNNYYDKGDLIYVASAPGFPDLLARRFPEDALRDGAAYFARTMPRKRAPK